MKSDMYEKSCNMDDRSFGLIGHPLSHSFSTEVHEALGEYAFRLFDLSFDEMKRFVSRREFSGLCVTRPYKQDVIDLCDKLTDRAAAIGAVNTLYWETCGEKKLLVGHNTDYDGFLYTARRSDIAFAGQKVLVLGTGGTSKTVRKVLEDEGAASIFFASRRDYGHLDDIADAIDIIINTTPVGMFPDNLCSLIHVKDFPNCTAVIDVIYNPIKTALIMEAEDLGLKTAGGMPMIVAQATAAAEKFLGKPGAFIEKNEEILSRIMRQMSNVILIGMPGCGKTTVGRKSAEISGRKFVDLDDEIRNNTGRSISDIFQEDGEAYFRHLETLASKEYGKRNGLVIATGGGVVTTPENRYALRQNGIVIWLTRPLDDLPMDGRPLSKDLRALEKMSAERAALYEDWSDFVIDSTAALTLLGGL